MNSNRKSTYLYTGERSEISISWRLLPLVSTTFFATKNAAIKQNDANIEYKILAPNCSSNRKKNRPTKKFTTWNSKTNRSTLEAKINHKSSYYCNNMQKIIQLKQSIFLDPQNISKLIQDNETKAIYHLSFYFDCTQRPIIMIKSI